MWIDFNPSSCGLIFKGSNTMLFDSNSKYPVINGIGSINSNVHVLKHHVDLIRTKNTKGYCGLKNRRFDNKKETD